MSIQYNKYELDEKLWHAWINAMPSVGGAGSKVLHVAGRVLLDDSDSATLSFSGLRKTNPPTLVLKIDIGTQLNPPEPNVAHFHYAETSHLGEYLEVVVVLGEKEIALPIGYVM
jgi:hypothetical protein